jgi:hypothetical protein
MLYDAVAFDHGVFRNLRAVAHGRDGIIVKAGFHAGVAVHFNSRTPRRYSVTFAFNNGAIELPATRLLNKGPVTMASP